MAASTVVTEESMGGTISSICLSFSVVMTLVMSLRLFTRFHVTKMIGVDDGMVPQKPSTKLPQRS
jgi:hypothetical protein